MDSKRMGWPSRRYNRFFKLDASNFLTFTAKSFSRKCFSLLDRVYYYYYIPILELPLYIYVLKMECNIYIMKRKISLI